VSQLVEFQLADGSTVLVAVADDSGRAPAAVTRGGGGGASDQVAEKATTTFEGALDRVKPMTTSLIQKLRAIDDPPDEIEVSFGIDFHAELGAFVASASTDANISVSLTWKRDPGK
jgi:hypothetical protein